MAVICVLLAGTGCGKAEKRLEATPDDKDSKNPVSQQTHEEAINPGPNERAGEPMIVVFKRERILELYSGDSLVGRYPIDLGRDPSGDKQKEGDGRTPEGTYYVCTRNEQSRYYLSLGVSYPNEEDAKKALENGIIEEETYERIKAAEDNLSKPPWDTPMGGEIMIHGMGTGEDWTAGCIAVKNDVMDILWRSCPLGTPIIIHP